MPSVSIRVRKLLLRLVAVLVVAVGVPVLIAGPASAHHPEITGSVDCAGTVSFTARSWNGATEPEKTNPDIQVSQSVDNGVTYTAVQSGAFNKANNYQFAGTFSIGSAAKVILKVLDVGKWGNGSAGNHPQYYTVNAPTNCGTDVVITNTCTDTTATMTNNGVAAVTYDVTISPKATEAAKQSVTVPGKATGSVKFTGLTEDTIYTVSVKQGNTELKKVTIPVDCSKPTATIAQDCTSYTITLDNTASSARSTFVVTTNGVAKSYVVNPRSAFPVKADVAEDSSTTLKVTFNGATILDQVVKIDCEQPKAVITHTCTGYAVQLDNSGSKTDLTFMVKVGNAAAKPYLVRAGQVGSATGSVVEDQATTITVTVKNKTIATDTFTEDCEKPTASFVQDCTSFTVVLDNSKSNKTATYTVTIDGVTKQYPVGKTSLPIKTVAAEDSSHSVKVVLDGKVLLEKSDILIDCEKPVATIKHDCTSYSVKLDNTGSKVDLDFVVSVNGINETVNVKAGQVGSASGSAVEDQVTTITVNVKGIKIATEKFTENCEKPVATFTKDCTSFTVTLDNSKNNVDATYTVTIDGVAKTYVVGKSPETIVTQVAEDSTHTVKVEWDGNVLIDESVKVDCEEPKATITHDCTGYAVDLDNSKSIVDLTFVVTVNGVSTNHVVPAKASVPVTGPVVEDEETTITVAVKGQTIQAEKFTENCQQPAATITNSCTDYTVNLGNSLSTVPVDFTVTVNGVDTTYTLAKGETKAIVTPAFEGSTYDVKVTSGTTLLAEKIITIDCAKPIATVANTCTGYTVTLDNTASTVPVTFTVTIDGVSTDHVVADKATKTLTGSVAEDSSHIISVANGKETLAQASFTVDCVKPTAMVAQSCLGYDVTLDNSSSTIPVEFTVTFNGVVQLVTVPNGQVKHVTGDVVEDSTNTITVRGGGADLVNTTFTKNCETFAPAAAVTHDCTTYTATLNNAGSNIPVDFTVNVNGVNQVVSVAGGQTQQVTGPVVEDGAYTVTVSAGGAQLVSGSFIVDCVEGDGAGGSGGNGGSGGDNNGNNGGNVGGGGAGGTGSDTPSSDDGVLPATGSPALLGLALLLGLGLVTGGGLLVAGDRRRLRTN